jgi:hypothetical protein
LIRWWRYATNEIDGESVVRCQWSSIVGGTLVDSYLTTDHGPLTTDGFGFYFLNTLYSKACSVKLEGEGLPSTISWNPGPGLTGTLSLEWLRMK